MKKLLTLLMVVIVVGIFIGLGMNVTVNAYTEGKYSYTVSNKEATITDFSDSFSERAIEIPSSLGGYPVTSIG